MVVPASDVYVWTRPYTDSRVATRYEQEVRTATNLRSEPRNVSSNGAFGYVALTPAKTVVENVYNRRLPSFCTPGKNIETGAAELYITALARQTVNANNANDETHSLTPHAARMVAGSPTAANHRATLRVASTVSATSRVILRNAFDVNDARLGPTATAPPGTKTIAWRAAAKRSASRTYGAKFRARSPNPARTSGFSSSHEIIPVIVDLGSISLVPRCSATANAQKTNTNAAGPSRAFSYDRTNSYTSAPQYAGLK